MISGTATSVTYYAYDRTTLQAKTGDDANHTIRVVHDGSEITPAGVPFEIDGANMPGWYSIDLTGTENTGGFMTVGGKSSTANINIQGQIWVNESSSPIYGAVAMRSLSVINTSGDAVTVTSTGGNGHGANLRGDGIGSGLNITGGSSGSALSINNNDASDTISIGNNGIGRAIGIAVGSADAVQIASNDGNGLILASNNGGNGLRIVSGSGDALAAFTPGAGSSFSISGGKGITVNTSAGPGIDLTNVNGGEPIAYIVADATSNPGTNATFDRRFAWMSNLAQFKLDESATQQQVYAADGVTVIGTAPVSDLAGVTTRDTYV